MFGFFRKKFGKNSKNNANDVQNTDKKQEENIFQSIAEGIKKTSELLLLLSNTSVEMNKGLKDIRMQLNDVKNGNNGDKNQQKDIDFKFPLTEKEKENLSAIKNCAIKSKNYILENSPSTASLPWASTIELVLLELMDKVLNAIQEMGKEEYLFKRCNLFGFIDGLQVSFIELSKKYTQLITDAIDDVKFNNGDFPQD